MPDDIANAILAVVQLCATHIQPQAFELIVETVQHALFQLAARYRDIFGILTERELQ